MARSAVHARNTLQNQREKQVVASRILVVEDEPDMAQLLARRLTVLAPLVEIAADGPSALRRATTESYDLIVLDLVLPGRSGLHVCSSVRAQGNYTPIIMVTAKSSETERIAGLDAGADDYMTKPFSMEELLSRSRALLRRVRSWREIASSEPSLTVGPLLIDVAKRRIRRDGVSITLRAKEFDLLVILARAPGKVFSRAELLKQVWGYDHEGYRHTVDTHVSRLRAKIEADPSAPCLIKTVWGLGYRLSEPER